MDHRSDRSVPLLGALLVADGLITQEQLEACLLLQTQDYAGVQLGQVLIRCGYITPADLQRVLQLQADIKAALVREATMPVACQAILLQQQNRQQLLPLLERLRVFVKRASDWQTVQTLLNEERIDCLLIDPSLPAPPAALIDQMEVPIWFIPSIPSSGTQASPWLTAALTRFIEQVRELSKARILLKYHQDDQKILATIIRRTSTIRSARDGLEQLVVALRDRLGVEAATLFRVDRATDRIIFEIACGPGGAQLEGVSFPTSQGIAGWVARNKQPLLLPNVTRDTRFEHTFDRQTGFQSRSMLCVPLLALGEIRGVLQLINKTSGEAFTGRDLALLRTISGVAALLQYLAE